MTNKTCPECGAEQDGAFKYCKDCGTLLADENAQGAVKICPKCGTREEGSFKFCRNCGASLTSGNNVHNEGIRRCSQCGAEINDERFCPDCGKSTGIKICPNCRQKSVNEDFCSVCGYRLNPNIKICRVCGSQIDVRAGACANCGAAVENKNPIVALVLSFVFPGLGQFYNDQTHKGIYFVIGYVISLILCLIIIGIILALFIWVYGMYDAFVSAKALNNGEIIEDKIF